MNLYLYISSLHSRLTALRLAGLPRPLPFLDMFAYRGSQTISSREFKVTGACQNLQMFYWFLQLCKTSPSLQLAYTKSSTRAFSEALHASLLVPGKEQFHRRNSYRPYPSLLSSSLRTYPLPVLPMFSIYNLALVKYIYIPPSRNAGGRRYGNDAK